MTELFAHLMVTAVIGIMAWVFIELLNFLLRRRVIKSGKMDENYLELLTKNTGRITSLKWGIIFLFAGLGLVVIGMLPFNPETSPIPWGIEVIFVGFGFLVYYFLTKKKI